MFSIMSELELKWQGYSSLHNSHGECFDSFICVENSSLELNIEAVKVFGVSLL